MNLSQHSQQVGLRRDRVLGPRTGVVMIGYLVLAVVTAAFPTAMSTRVIGHLSLGLVLVALQVAVMVTVAARGTARTGRPSTTGHESAYDRGARA
ncbi:DUF485 domain-containing protein [Streptomyces sp. cmx-10-25]|uniref:DUF485 domain-containing protein n=1 Tax=Streptomyces sp. cmx-10-25 TaxID=2790919 RepID=UPI00397F2C7E